MVRFVQIFALPLLLISVSSCSRNPVIVFETDLGSIEAELYIKEAPITAGNFLRHIDSGTFVEHQALFYRVVRPNNQPYSAVKIVVIQGGLFEDDLVDSILPIEHETTQTTGILHTDGVLSMARNEPGTASTEFFICIGNHPGLDYGGSRNSDGQGFAAFGKVIKGMDVVLQIQELPDERQYLLEPVPILSIRRK